jgi:hypothetical protein
MIRIVSVTDAYKLGEDDETLFIRKKLYDSSKYRSDTDIRKIVEQVMVENCVILYAIYYLLLCIITSILPSYSIGVQKYLYFFLKVMYGTDFLMVNVFGNFTTISV